MTRTLDCDCHDTLSNHSNQKLAIRSSLEEIDDVVSQDVSKPSQVDLVELRDVWEDLLWLTRFVRYHLCCSRPRFVVPGMGEW